MKKLKMKKNQYKGKLIVFEGTDGAGKTTMLQMTAEYISSIVGKSNVICIKQPTDISRKTKLFQKMMYSECHDDIDYRAVQLLTMSDRVQHLHEIIEPALKEGKFVICDRYIYTSLANMLARGYVREKWFYNVSSYLLKPDITFLARVSAEVAINRIRSREEEKDRYLNEELLKNVLVNFIQMAKKEKFVVIDTDMKPEAVFCQIKEELYRRGVLIEKKQF